jgi:hypothetical protein
MAVLVLAGTVVLTGCDKADQSGATSSDSSQTGAVPEQPATGTDGTTTTTP